MINKYTSSAQKCQICPDVLLESIGTQLYCRNCNRFSSQLQQQLRVVPEKYESNSKSKAQLEKQRRYNNMIRQFSDKIRDIQTTSEIDLFRKRLVLLKNMSDKKKGLRQSAAVIVYCQMYDEIKLNIKDFCKNNNINVKAFNQKYKVYMLKIKGISQQVIKQTKMQQKIEECQPTEKSQQLLFDSQPEQEIFEKFYEIKTQEAKHAINLIFQLVFQKYIFKEKKIIIIQGLLKKIKNLNQDFLRKIKYQENSTLKLYYIIYSIIKSLGHKIKYAEYDSIIRSKTGFVMKRKALSEIKKLYEQSNNKQIQLKEQILERQGEIRMTQ